MIISEFHNVIYRHVSKYLEMAEESWEQSYLPLLLLFFLVFRYVLDLNTQKSPSFSDSKGSLFYNLGQIIFEN